jgi:PAT family beta-lactamase induction signal transducer AmpG
VRPAAIGSVVAAVGVPCTLQFVWVRFIDRFQRSPMGRRRPWVLLAQSLALAASFGLLLVGDPVADLGALTAAFCVHSVCASVQDASVDAMMISTIPAAERGRVNAFMRGGMLFGIGAGAAALAYLLRHGGFARAALAQSLVLLALTAVTLFVRERRGDALLPFGRRAAAAVGAPERHEAPALRLRAIFAELLRGLFGARSVRAFGAILCVYLSASVFVRTFSVHLIQRLRWQDTALSVLTGVYGMGVALAAVFVAGLLADRVGARRLLTAMMLVIGGFLVTFNLLAPLWANPAVARAGLVLWYTFDPGFSVAAMPLLMALCREGVEGAQFTTYMALVNLADVFGSFVSGHALAVAPAPVIGLACGVTVLAAAAVARRATAGVGS